MDLTFADPFYEVSALVLFAACIGLLGMLLRQPLIVAFLVVGILAGPSVLGFVTTSNYIGLMSKMSIAVLLFLVGLKLDVKLVRSLGRVALATGLGQVVFTAVVGAVLCLAMGIDIVPATFIAIALTFSSTIIIVKLLTDKREIDSLHGKIALGFLIVQDIVVVLSMVVLSAFGFDSEASDVHASATIIGIVVFLLFIALFIRYAATGIMNIVSRSQELLIVFGVGWAVSLGAICDAIGFGMELGGLLAGVSLASTQYRDAVSSKLSSVRDFLLLFFFVGLGASLDVAAVGQEVGRSIALSVFVLVGNPLIVLVIMRAMGYQPRTGFLAGLTVAQISEFSLIFMAMGATLGYVEARYVGLVTLVGLITITVSTYMITYSHTLYEFLSPLLKKFKPNGKLNALEHVDTSTAKEYDVLLIGLGRYGVKIGNSMEVAGLSVLGVDFDPAALQHWMEGNRPGIYGDVTDRDFVSHLPLSHCRVILVTIPGQSADLTSAEPIRAILEAFRDANFLGKIILTVRSDVEFPELLLDPRTTVFRTFDDAADRAVERILDLMHTE